MAANIVKCSNCNIVINEVLAFMCNKIHVMDENSLLRICVTAFPTEEVAIAKKLLFEAVPLKKMINRKKDAKSRKDLEDIIDLLKYIDASDPEKLPIFVAKELHKLPPVTFDHLDATRLLKDLLIIQDKVTTLQEEMGCFKQEYVSHQQLSEYFKKQSVTRNEINPINVRKDGCLSNSCEIDSDLMGLSQTTSIINHPAIQQIHSQNSSSRNNDNVNKELMTVGDVDASSVLMSARPDVDNHNISVCESKSPERMTHIVAQTTYAAAAAISPILSKQSISNNSNAICKELTEGNNDGWTEVSYKKRLRNKFLSNTGTASCDSNCNFRAAIYQVPLYISNVCKETSEQNIVDYIKSKTQVSVKLELINTKKERGYNSYRFYVNKDKVDSFLSDSFWPEGIRFREFVVFKSKDRASVSSVNKTG
ncbi:hypothetical protein B5X24_HaOG211259 [Helicoverpa armigera]|uniref:Mutant cadherin n=1 Tax=Helicoverpa armigera TaxID=29058 RepID=A0A2W1BF69_HELAM|nr:hypothetical protein B5X24_HaOG211259 [Helicoverpa armigera]